MTSSAEAVGPHRGNEMPRSRLNSQCQYCSTPDREAQPQAPAATLRELAFSPSRVTADRPGRSKLGQPEHHDRHDQPAYRGRSAAVQQKTIETDQPASARHSPSQVAAKRKMWAATDAV